MRFFRLPFRSASLRPVVFALVLGGGAAQAMEFRLVSVGGQGCGPDCPQVIAAEGEIERDSADRFARFLKTHIAGGRMRNIVFLNSPGGNVTGAIRLGTTFRKLGSAVVVAEAHEGEWAGQTAEFTGAKCMSACVYALMGGKKRVVPLSSQLGLHRTASYQFIGKDPANAEPGYQRIETPAEMIEALTLYAKTMGIGAGVIEAAQQVPHEKIRILTRKEIAKWKLGDPNF